jgi:agmatine deiminase
MTTSDSPAALGYRMPAEWAVHRATWLSWPHNRDTWPGCFERVEPAMVEVVEALAEFENVYINVLGPEHEGHVHAQLERKVAPERVRYFHVPTNDAWIRDHGAIFVLRDAPEDPILALDFDYNAWGGKYPPYDLDREVARRMADALGVRRVAPGAVLEGGSIEVNGEGTLITTEQCLLNANRNPELGRGDIESLLRDAFGVQRIIWLGDGIVGDDTDGHVDDLTRFVGADTVVTAVESDPADPNYAVLRANRTRLAAIEQAGELPFHVVEFPMPEPQFNGGERLPASYANFYIANGCVLMPAFGCPADERARDLLAGCFPGRRVVPIDCRALVAGLGALHCLTQQVPEPPR